MLPTELIVRTKLSGIIEKLSIGSGTSELATIAINTLQITATLLAAGLSVTRAYGQRLV